MKTRLRQALAIIALIALAATLLPPSALAEARTSFVRSQIDSRPAKLYGEVAPGIETVPHKTENPERSEIWDGSIAAGFAGGNGTQGNPYLISDGSELAYLAQEVNGGHGYSGVYFKLTNDIYLNDTSNWTSWGNGATPQNEWTAIGRYIFSNLRIYYSFEGFFDGDGYAVRGIYNTQEGSQGLFGYIRGDSTITNLGVAESYICGDRYVGGMVGYNDGGDVTNCYNIGTVTSTGIYVGGVVGYNDGGDVTNCYNTGSVTGHWEVGGVVGDNLRDDVTNCYNTGTVTGDDAVGGVVGWNASGNVTNCYYCIDCCAGGNSIGTALTNEQMHHAESFAGFDFNSVWTMDGNPDYPYPELVGNIHGGMPAVTTEPGDANGDGAITMADATLIARMALNLIASVPAADFNGDGSISMADATLTARKALNLI